MRLPLVRLVVAYVGLAVAVYALASLTGGWLGTPPWWERRVATTPGPLLTIDGGRTSYRPWSPIEPAPQRELISRALVAVGSAAAALGLASAWPRRSRASPTGAP